MGFPNIIAGPADLYQYKRNTTSIAAASQLTNGGEVTEGTENPKSGIEGATRIQASTAYNLAVVWFGAYDQGGLACTLPPTNYAHTTGSGKNAIKVTLTAPAYALAMGLLVNNSLAAVSATPLAVRNGAAGATQIVCYYEPSVKAVTRAQMVEQMTGVTVYGFDRVAFAETTGDTTLTVTPTTINQPRNAGSDITLVTGFTVQASASLLATGKSDLADILNGIATLSGGLKTKQEAVFGFRGLGTPSARPIEIVGPGETVGAEDSILIFSALKLSDQAITKTWSKDNPSQVPVTFTSAEDQLMKGVHGSFAYFVN